MSVDLIGEFNHEDDNYFNSTLELDPGSMLTARFGLNGEIFVGAVVFRSKLYQTAIGLAMRVIY